LIPHEIGRLDVPENQKQARQESLAIARAQRGQSIDTAGRAKGRDAFRRGPSRPGRNRTCNPRFWSALAAAGAVAAAKKRGCRCTPASSHEDATHHPAAL